MERIKWRGVLLAGMILMVASCVPSEPSSISNIELPTAISSTSTISSNPAPVSTELPKEASVREFPDIDLYAWNLVTSGFSQPVDMSIANDGSDRFFVVEQRGMIQVVNQGVIRPQPFLDLNGKVDDSGYEQGLLGLAFHPAFRENGYIYVNYTDKSGNTVIARYSVDITVPPDTQSANPSSELIVLQIRQPYSNHNGGQIMFGPDRMLWISVGDGGSGGDPLGNGQSTQTLLGKILRIDVNQDSPYGIPLDNPYFSGGGLPEIWAIGLRNTWKFSFDSQDGDLYLADVGQNQWEEINFLPSGFNQLPANFGWNLREGRHDYQKSGSVSDTTLIDPIFEYGHDQGCSVTGGMVYRGGNHPEFNGIYLFGDFCSGTVWGLLRLDDDVWQSQILFETGLNISSFGVDELGEIYLLDMNGGLYKLQKK
ncbi:PQQ-dependent sugar dehydrogenase [Chloroflexota bacterium]